MLFLTVPSCRHIEVAVRSGQLAWAHIKCLPGVGLGMGRCLGMPSSGPSVEVGEGSSNVDTSPGPGPGPCVCRIGTRTARLGIAVIGARSIAQEISRGADGCKGLVNYSKILTREGRLKLQQRVAAPVVATVGAMVTVVVASPNPRNGPKGTLAPDDPLIMWNNIPAPPRCGFLLDVGVAD